MATYEVKPPYRQEGNYVNDVDEHVYFRREPMNLRAKLRMLLPENVNLSQICGAICLEFASAKVQALTLKITDISIACCR
jgi:hypothetical protein